MKALEEIKTIHLIPYAHCDYAWTNTRQWHVWRYLEGLTRVTELMKQDKEFTFLIDNVMQTVELLKRYLPSRMALIKQFVAEGRISVVNGGMDLVRPGNCGDELFIRNMQEGKRVLTRELGCDEIGAYLNADTGIGHSQLPQLLRLGGHSAYRLYRPGGAMDAMGVPGEFCWKGLDESEITVSRGNYAGLAGEYITSAEYARQREGFLKEEARPKLAIQQTEDLAVFVGGDDALPLHTTMDRPVDMVAFMDNWNSSEKPRMQYSTLYDYFAKIQKQSLPVVEGVIDACELSYNIPSKSTDAMYRARFGIERKLVTAEKLGVMLGELGGGFAWDVVRELWNGLMGISGHALEALIAGDYEEKLNFARCLEYRAVTLIQDTVEQIACAAKKLGQVQHVVVNPHLFAAKGFLKLHITSPMHVNGFRLLDSNGDELAYQVTQTYYGDKPYVGCLCNEVDVVVRIVCPPFGYESITVLFDRPMREGWDAEITGVPHVIENGALRVTQKDGVIKRLECADGTVLFAEGEAFAQLRFYQTEPTQDWVANFEPKAEFGFEPERVVMVADGGLYQSFEVAGSIAGQSAKITYTLHRDVKEIGVDVELEHAGREGYYTMAFACDAQPEIVAGIPFGQERRDTEKDFYSASIKEPAEEYLKYERAMQGQYFARHFTSFENNGRKTALLQGNCSIYYCHNAAWRCVETVLLHTMERSERTEPWVKKTHDSFFGTGRHSFSFQVALDWQDTNSEMQNLCLLREQPLVSAVRFTEEEGTNPAARSLLRVDGMVVTAIYKEDEALVVRGFEAEGRHGCATICWKDQRIGTACTLEPDDVGQQVALKEIGLRPYEIKTVKIGMVAE